MKGNRYKSSELYSLILWLCSLSVALGSFEYNAQTYPKFSTDRTDKGSSGYFFLTALKPPAVSTNTSEPYCNMIIDHKGEVVYYKKFPGNQKVCDFKILPNGRMSYFQKNQFMIMDKEFNIIDSVYCLNGIQTDNHEIVLLPNGNYALLGIETLTMNLQPYKVFNHLKVAGSHTAQVLCGVIQEQNQNRNVVFEWKSKENYSFMDVDTFYLSDHTKVDWTHFNSLAIDKDGNYLVSVRNFNEVTKISRKDSSIIWRLGGHKNQFKFKNDPEQFIGQHDARRLGTGNLTLFDNGREQISIHAAAAKEYQLNEKTFSATLVWKFVNDHDAHSIKGLGNVQRLSNGSTLVNYGTSSNSLKVFSILMAGKKIFELQFEDTLRSYRVYNYLKLPWPLIRPSVKMIHEKGKTFLVATAGYASYNWSNGGRTQKIEITEPGNYQVWVPAGKSGWISSTTYFLKKLPFIPAK